jgi:hypothetical protein
MDKFPLVFCLDGCQKKRGELFANEKQKLAEIRQKIYDGYMKALQSGKTHYVVRFDLGISHMTRATIGTELYFRFPDHLRGNMYDESSEFYSSKNWVPVKENDNLANYASYDIMFENDSMM